MNQFDFSEAPARPRRRRQSQNSGGTIVLSLVAFVVLCFGCWLAWDFVNDPSAHRIRQERETEQKNREAEKIKRDTDEMLRDVRRR